MGSCEVIQATLPDGRDLIGMSEDDATKALAHFNFTYRITSRDDEYFFVTTDWNPGRYNLDIKDGNVVKIKMG